MKKIGLFILGFALVVLSSGCATTTRTIRGVASGIGGTVYGFGTGVVKDTKGTTNTIIKADQWFRKNCW